jgi:hypothetical protein
LIGRRIQPKGSQGTIGEAAVLLLSASPLLGYRRDLVNSGVLKSVSTRPKRNTLLLVFQNTCWRSAGLGRTLSTIRTCSSIP